LTDEATRELISRSAAGDVLAFEQLVRRFQSYAFALAMRLLCNPEEAKDVVQESFIRLWKNLNRFDQKKTFTTWLYSIVTNLALDRLRAIKRNRRLFISRDEESKIDETLDGFDLHEIHSQRELASIIKTLTGELPLKQRLVFVLRDLQDLTVEEVADVTGMSPGSVKTNLHFARRRIRRYLVEYYRVGSLES